MIRVGQPLHARDLLGALAEVVREREAGEVDDDADPDFISTDVLRVVLFGKGGDDSLVAGPGPDDRMSHRAELYGGLGNDFLQGGR